MQLSQVKQTFTEENFKRSYGDIQLENYLSEISSRFNKDFDVDCFYFAVFSFVNFGGFTTKVFYKKFLEGSEYQDFKDWFKKDVERKYLEKLLN